MYVKQICDGYSKKSLLGNWFEERQYPDQPFREEQRKQARGKDEGITCFDETGFQRMLPRIERRTKWETAGRIVLHDGYNVPNTATKAAFNYQELATASALTKQPFSKNFSQVFSTELHPNSQIRPNKQEHRMLNRSNIEEVKKERAIDMNNSFCSPLPSTSPQEKCTNYVSHYKLHFDSPADRKDKSLLNLTAGTYNQNPEEAVKISTTMVGEFKKEAADEKERTPVQRSWVPPKDKSLIFGARESVQQFKKSSIPANDIQTSLNMNIGIHNIHPKDVGNNYFGHKLSQITRDMNRSPCHR